MTPQPKGRPFVCPACGSALNSVSAGSLLCSGCRRAFAIEDGIPRLFWPDQQEGERDVTTLVKEFYEAHPFPDYENLDSTASLKDKSRKGVFARLLDEQISDRASILEAGCGTGQLANFLALVPDRTVVATDLCLNSLRLAHDFKSKHQIENATFAQMNLFRPALESKSFDIVVSTGVLHHTSDPCRGFRTLSRLVKKGGFILVGLYNRWGRLPTDLRRSFFRLTGDRLKSLDPRLRSSRLGARRKTSWFMDQYKHPHESKHTIGEVLSWFDDNGFEFTSGLPKPEAFGRIADNEMLFRAAGSGTVLDHFVVQLGMPFTIGKEGGLFVMIGRRIR